MKELIVIAGVTASGKTRLGIELAKQINGEIISADSVAVYRELNIGSAKVTVEEREGIPHHLIDIRNYDELYSVYDFQREAKECIRDIKSRGKIPIIVGGTGLYINAILYDYKFEKETQSIPENYFENFSNEELYHKLLQVNPLYGEKVHPNNRKRVMRLLFRIENGDTIELEQTESMNYNASVYFLSGKRETLYFRINQRVDEMLRHGLVDEIKNIYTKSPDCFEYLSFQSIGYREFKDYFLGNSRLEEVSEAIKQNTRRFAKRQITWFTNKTKAKVIDIEKEEPLKIILDDLR